jgi:hypothetical protein
MYPRHLVIDRSMHRADDRSAREVTDVGDVDIFDIGLPFVIGGFTQCAPGPYERGTFLMILT